MIVRKSMQGLVDCSIGSQRMRVNIFGSYQQNRSRCPSRMKKSGNLGLRDGGPPSMMCCAVLDPVLPREVLNAKPTTVTTLVYSLRSNSDDVNSGKALRGHPHKIHLPYHYYHSKRNQISSLKTPNSRHALTLTKPRKRIYRVQRRTF